MERKKEKRKDNKKEEGEKPEIQYKYLSNKEIHCIFNPFQSNFFVNRILPSCYLI
jgi:hypothetical protein